MHFIRQPFQDGVDTDFFFAGGTRKEIVDEMNRCIDQGIPLITVTGAAGSGKTMVCRMVEKQLPAGVLPLFLSPGRGSLADSFETIPGLGGGGERTDGDETDTGTILDDIVMPRTLESFDDILSIIFEHVVGEDIDDQEETDTDSILADVVSALEKRKQRLLIVLDDAEKIYLAPLERLRRMLDQINEDSVVVQLLFSGRPLLAEHFEQLSIVKFKDIEERHFVLQPLDTESTQAYLHHCMQVGTGEASDLFSREIVNKIFSAARGNFKKINQLAREYLNAENLDRTFLKVLDSHQDIVIEPADEWPSRTRATPERPRVDLDFLKVPSFKPQWLLYGGGTCAIALLVLLLMGRSGDDGDNRQEGPEVPVLELKNVEPLDSEVTAPPSVSTDVTADKPLPETIIIEPQVTIEEGTKSPPANGSRVTSAPEPEDQRRTTLKPAGDAGEERGQANAPMTAAESAVGQPPQSGDAESSARAETGPGASTTIVETEEDRESEPVQEAVKPELTEKRDAPEVEAAAVVRETDSEQAAAQAKIVVKPLREKKEIQQPGTVRILESRNKKIPIGTAPASEPEPANRGAGDASLDKIYRERLVAGARWMVGNNTDRYTVQIMVLASAQAEQNLKEMLHSKDYQSVADKLFILRHLGTPTTVKLFYGEYETLAAARKARNTLPLFFREYQPFAVTVSDAVEGIRTLP